MTWTISQSKRKSWSKMLMAQVTTTPAWQYSPLRNSCPWEALVSLDPSTLLTMETIWYFRIENDVMWFVVNTNIYWKLWLTNAKFISVVNSSIVFLLEPFHGIIFGDSVLGSNSAFASSSKADSASWALEDNVEVHAEDTGEGVILDTKIDVFLDTETEASAIWEISLSQFSVLDLETSFKDLVSLFSSDGDMHGYFFVSLDAETSDGVLSSRGDWLLPSEILQNFTS